MQKEQRSSNAITVVPPMPMMFSGDMPRRAATLETGSWVSGTFIMSRYFEKDTSAHEVGTFSVSVPVLYFSFSVFITTKIAHNVLLFNMMILPVCFCLVTFDREFSSKYSRIISASPKSGIGLSAVSSALLYR